MAHYVMRLFRLLPNYGTNGSFSPRISQKDFAVHDCTTCREFRIYERAARLRKTDANKVDTQETHAETGGGKNSAAEEVTQYLPTEARTKSRAFSNGNSQEPQRKAKINSAVASNSVKGNYPSQPAKLADS